VNIKNKQSKGNWGSESAHANRIKFAFFTLEKKHEGHSDSWLQSVPELWKNRGVLGRGNRRSRDFRQVGGERERLDRWVVGTFGCIGGSRTGQGDASKVAKQEERGAVVVSIVTGRKKEFPKPL